jgi:hypothetical protein
VISSVISTLSPSLRGASGLIESLLFAREAISHRRRGREVELGADCGRMAGGTGRDFCVEGMLIEIDAIAVTS